MVEEKEVKAVHKFLSKIDVKKVFSSVSENDYEDIANEMMNTAISNGLSDEQIGTLRVVDDYNFFRLKEKAKYKKKEMISGTFMSNTKGSYFYSYFI